MDLVVQAVNRKPLVYKNTKLGLYEIDEYGNIYSNYKKDYLIPIPDKDGYIKVALSGGTRKNKCYVRIATLVAIHFIGNPPKEIKDTTVNHKDGKILNNHYSNLEWIERSENSSIRSNKGIGSNNYEAQLNEKQVNEICNLLINTHLSYKEIGNIYGVDKSTINNIKQGKTWKHITNKFQLLHKCRQHKRNSNGTFESYNPLLVQEQNNKGV